MPKKTKVTALAIYRNILKEERHSRANAVNYSKSRDKYDRKEMVACSLADADDYKKLAELVKAAKWTEAFKFWRELDTFVRGRVPSEHAEFMARKVIAAYERKHK